MLARVLAWTRRVGIDLGLKNLATLSTGEKVEVPKFYRKSEERLATVQRARKTRRARAIHAKIANRRKDFLHKASAKLAKEYGLIFVGDVSPSKLAQTKMAKSVHDAGWSRFRDMLAWKLRLRSGGVLVEVSEHLTTQTCSECGCLPSSRPRGIAGLGIREWTCDVCGTVHDRDVNAAKNILRCGLVALAEGALTSRMGSPAFRPRSSHKGTRHWGVGAGNGAVGAIAPRSTWVEALPTVELHSGSGLARAR